MKRKILSLILPISLFIFIGCGNQNDKSNNTSTNKNLLSSSATKNSEKSSHKKISFSNELSYYSPFIFNDGDLIFTNPEENNRISMLPEPLQPEILNSKLVTSFVDYSSTNIVLIKNTLYFSDDSKGSNLYSINVSDKSLTQINNHSVQNLTSYKNKLFYTSVISFGIQNRKLQVGTLGR